MNAPHVTLVAGQRVLACACGHREEITPNTAEEALTAIHRHAEGHMRDRHRGAAKRHGSVRCEHDKPLWACMVCIPPWEH